MAIKLTTVGELPESFQDKVMTAFRDYSVAMGRFRNENPKEFHPIGSGVLVEKGNRFGILTAHHCLHECSPEVELGLNGKDSLALILRGGRSVILRPSDLMEHELGMPKSPEFGPDLSFIEVVHGERLSSLKAIGSFWSLDRPVEPLFRNFSKGGTVVASIGFPQVNYSTEIKGKDIHHGVRHVTFLNSIAKNKISKKGGWDYLDCKCVDDPVGELPNTFRGVSGGPVWAMVLQSKKDEITIKKSALVGITFYETDQVGNERNLRAHFIHSIYTRAWKNVVFPGEPKKKRKTETKRTTKKRLYRYSG